MWKVVVFLMCAFVCIASDKLIIPHIMIPMVVSSVWIAVKHKRIGPLILVCGSILTGWLCIEIIDDYLFIPKSNHAPVTTIQSIGNFGRIVQEMLSNNPVTGVLVVCQAFLWVIYVYIFFRLKETFQQVLWLTMLISTVSVLAFPILYGYIQDKDTLRYVVHAFIISAIMLPLAVSLVYNRTSNLNSFVYLIPNFVVLIVGVMLIPASPKLTNYIHYKSIYVSLIDENNLQLKQGVSDYWYTKQPYLFGKYRTRLVSVYPNSNEAYIWEANKNWFIGNDESNGPVFNFSLNLNLSPYLGNPIDTISKGHDTIFIYPDFIFTNVKGKGLMLTPL